MNLQDGAFGRVRDAADRAPERSAATPGSDGTERPDANALVMMIPSLTGSGGTAG